MKTFAYLILMGWMSIILSACTSETTVLSDQIDRNAIDIEQAERASEATTIIKKNTDTKDTVWLKEKSLFQFKAVDGNYPYTVFLFAEDERSSILTESNSYGNKGDVIQKGNFSVYLSEKDSAIAYKQDILFDKPLIFNEAKKNSYKFQMGEKTIISFMQTENAAESRVYLFAIKDGEVQPIKANEELVVYGSKIKPIGQFYLQTLQYQQHAEKKDYEWVFTTYSFNQKNLALLRIDETMYNDQLHSLGMETGQYWYGKWSEQEETYFPFRNLTIESGMVMQAKLGILQGSQYPIGTNIDDILKANPHFVEKGEKDGTSYVMYPEVTYYLDSETGNVMGVMIPGQRFKVNLQQVTEKIGQPLLRDKWNEGTSVSYLADKYILEMKIDPSGYVEAVILRKR